MVREHVFLAVVIKAITGIQLFQGQSATLYIAMTYKLII